MYSAMLFDCVLRFPDSERWPQACTILYVTLSEVGYYDVDHMQRRHQ